ncbi:hypothetical protein VF21_01885 [Pseudogymnoascus sp. 05NY08]|nr:hypothetical protein VF21_01885 [Pseudogymnoascus sp. 05NY08]
MALHTSRGPPLPAPTDTSSNSGVGVNHNNSGGAGADAGGLDGTELSRVTDQSDQTSYSIPEDGSPVTIPTRRREGADRISRESHPSQTSLLIEYFEGGKESQVESRRPSVRVKVTPSSGKSKGRSGGSGGHIQITKSRSGGKEEKDGGRKPSYTKRIHLSSSGGNTKNARLIDLEGDGQSLSSYASATEESNVSRNPIEIEVGPRRHRSPLIPDPDAPIREQVLGSDVSSMPANSFLDGDSGLRSERGSRGFSKNEALISGAAAGLGAAALGEALKAPTRRRSRSLSRERIITQKAAEKVRSAKSEHRHKHSRDRSVSDNAKRAEKHSEVSGGSPRRRSSRGHHDESLLSGESSLLTSSKLSERSHRSAASGKSSITNPKLLETVEDAIRRLILPELNALKKENASRDKYDREQREPRHRRSSLTSSSALSQESRDGETRSKRTSAGDASLKSKLGDDRDRAVSSGTVRPSKDRRSSRGGSESPRPHTPRTPRSADRMTGDESASRQKRSGDGKKSAFGALAAGIGLGALAGGMKNHSGHDEKEYDDKERAERRRRRARSRSRGDDVESFDRAEEEVPPMPMMSEVNASDITRSSILSASTERPRSAAAEKEGTPVKDVARGFGGSPYAGQGQGQRGLGMMHHNGSTPDVSRMDLRMGEGEYDLDEYGRKVPLNRSVDDSAYDQQAYHHDLDANKGGYGKAAAAAVGGGALGVLAANAMAHHNQHPDPHHEEDSRYLDEEDDDADAAYYAHTQHVPSPLKYVPYNQEKRGLSPIQSVSGYTEADEQERLQKQRDSRATMTQSSRSRGSLASTSLDQSPAHKAGSMRSDGVLGVDPCSFDFRDVRMGGLTDSELTQEGDLDHDADAGADAASEAEYQRHRNAAFEGADWAGANPDYIHTPVAVESAVASLLDASVLTGHTGEPSPALEGGYESHLGDGKGAAGGVNRQASYASYDEGSERRFTAKGISPAPVASPATRDLGPSDSHGEDTYPEYELDEQGRKITMPNYKQHTSKVTAIAGLAGAAAGTAATLLVNRHQVPDQHYAQQQQGGGHDQIPGAPLQKSFKDRARDYIPPSPRRGDMYLDSDEESSRAKMSANAIPGMGDPVDPVFAEDASVTTNPSVINGPSEPYSPTTADREAQQGDRDWYYKTPTPTRKAVGSAGSDSGSGLLRGADSDSGLRAAQMGLMDSAPLGGKHTRDQSLDEEWHRTSDERKRDTLITNPYEGSSPVTLLGGEKDRNLLGQLGYEGVRQNLGGDAGGYNTGSPVGAVPKDEGYISSAPNARSPGGVVTPEPKRGVVGFTDVEGMGPGEFEGGEGDDPFYTTQRHQRQLSGMSQGMESPLYDGAMGRHREAIKSKDIVALMDHLTVRDAQRNARDTEILVTLVRAAAEMRNSFEDMKRLLADTEDVVITEVQRNTDKSIIKAINGPRPLPQSVKSLRSGTGDDDDLPTKRRNVFKRALKGLSMRSTNDLAQIERMLVQLLGDVEGLKVAQGLSSVAREGGFEEDDYDDAHQEGAAEQDRGYEPEGHAGTTTASHASQSGHFSNPLSRGTSASQGFGGRKFSENRVSTVPEGDEDDNVLDYREQAILDNAYDDAEPLSPLDRNPRAGSAPLGTPPQRVEAANLSSENTPRTDKSKKHKSSGSFGWNPIPKISRWSETTASTVAKGFRSSGGRKDAAPNSPHTASHPPSRSGSDLGNYDHDVYGGGDKLHSGFSAATLPLQQSADSFAAQQPGNSQQQHHPEDLSNLPPLLPPEDPKYKAHRNSLNLQHPQPRTGHHYQGTLEREAQDFRGMGSPRSVDWGSTTSLDRLPQNANVNRYSNGTTGTEDSQGGQGGYDEGPARPPKEPLDSSAMGGQAQYPPKPAVRGGGKLTKPSPLATEQRVDYDDGDRRSASAASSARTYEGSPRAVHRSVSGLAAVPTRKPTGPRSMGSPRGAGVGGSGGGGGGGAGGSGGGGEGGKRGESSPSPGPGGEYRYW